MGILPLQELLKHSLLLTVLYHEYGGGGILSGFLHPLLGIDHLLAMVAVGIISTQIGGRAIWTVPSIFVGLMALGGLLGIFGVEFPMKEYGITGSVLVLGLAILTNGRITIPIAIVLVALFGLFHGNAHGLELPATTNTPTLTASYIAGFLIATAGLHLVGVFLGMMAEQRQHGPLLLRTSGSLIAIIGVFLIVQV